MGFACEDDARRVMEVLPKRFEQVRPDDPSGEDAAGAVRAASTGPRRSATPNDEQPAGTFDLLGFTHYWGRSRQGNWVVKRKTSKSRFRRGLQAVASGVE